MRHDSFFAAPRDELMHRLMLIPNLSLEPSCQGPCDNGIRDSYDLHGEWLGLGTAGVGFKWSPILSQLKPLLNHLRGSRLSLGFAQMPHSGTPCGRGPQAQNAGLAKEGVWYEPTDTICRASAHEIYVRIPGFQGSIWGVPKIRGPFVVVLIIRALLFWSPY